MPTQGDVRASLAWATINRAFGAGGDGGLVKTGLGGSEGASRWGK